MTPSELMLALLNASSPVVAACGGRIAVKELPQGVAVPAIVVSLVDADENPWLNHRTGGLMWSRVQINPLAQSMAGVGSLLGVIRTNINFTHNVLAGGVRVLSCRASTIGPESRDPVSGVWTQPQDYILRFHL